MNPIRNPNGGSSVQCHPFSIYTIKNDTFHRSYDQENASRRDEQPAGVPQWSGNPGRSGPGPCGPGADRGSASAERNGPQPVRGPGRSAHARGPGQTVLGAILDFFSRLSPGKRGCKGVGSPLGGPVLPDRTGPGAGHSAAGGQSVFQVAVTQGGA